MSKQKICDDILRYDINEFIYPFYNANFDILNKYIRIEKDYVYIEFIKRSDKYDDLEYFMNIFMKQTLQINKHKIKNERISMYKTLASFLYQILNGFYYTKKLNYHDERDLIYTNKIIFSFITETREFNLITEEKLNIFKDRWFKCKKLINKKKYIIMLLILLLEKSNIIMVTNFNAFFKRLEFFKEKYFLYGENYLDKPGFNLYKKLFKTNNLFTDDCYLIKMTFKKKFINKVGIDQYLKIKVPIEFNILNVCDINNVTFKSTFYETFKIDPMSIKKNVTLYYNNIYHHLTEKISRYKLLKASLINELLEYMIKTYKNNKNLKYSKNYYIKIWLKYFKMLIEKKGYN
jgi:hypothetical protein